MFCEAASREVCLQRPGRGCGGDFQLIVLEVQICKTLAKSKSQLRKEEAAPLRGSTPMYGELNDGSGPASCRTRAVLLTDVRSVVEIVDLRTCVHFELITFSPAKWRSL